MLKPRVLSALLAATVLTLSPAGAWAKAMSDKQFSDLCWNGTAAQVKQALADGANPNAADKGNASRTALMFASAWDKPDPEKVQALLAAGADPNARDKHGLTVLVYAAEKGNAEVMRLLLAAGAQVNGRTKDGETALMRAAMHRRSEAVKLLLAAGADASLKDSDGLDALWHARNQADNDEVVRLLEGGGAKKPAAQPAAAMPDAQFIALCGNGTAEQVKKALADGANPNARLNDPDADGTTALIAAAHTGSADTVAALLAAGADKSAQDKRGYDALWWAKNAAQYGVEYGGPRAERTPDPAALAAEHQKVIELLEGGAPKQP